MGRGMHAKPADRRAAAFDLPHKRPGRKRAAVVAACLAAMLCCGGALAWFHTESGLFNMFKAANVTPGVNEGFNSPHTVKENVYATNKGNVKAYLRASVSVRWETGSQAGGSAVVLGDVPELGKDYAMQRGAVASPDATAQPADSWIQGTDGLYYWPKPLAPESDATGGVAPERTANLIAKCEAFPNTSHTDGRHLVVEIDVQAVQADPVDAVSEAWGPDRGGAVTGVATDGTLTVSSKGGAA